MFHSIAYGLRVRSNRQIPGLSSSPAPDALGVDVDIHLGQPLDTLVDIASYQEHYVSALLTRAGQPIVVVYTQPETGSYLWVYDDGLRYVIDGSGNNVWAEWPGTATIEDSALNLLGPILGFILRLRGTTCLHASAIAVGGKAIALVGRPFAGKSTTAAALVGLGHALVSEDVVPIVDGGDRYSVVPGYPVIRLWPKSVTLLYGPDAALPLLTPSRDKRRLDLGAHGYAFQHETLPLAAIYCLERRSDDDRAPIVEPVSNQVALMSLVADTYTNYALNSEMRAREFDLLGRLLKTVPFRSVTPHTDAARLPRLCDAILEDFARLALQAPPERAIGEGAPVPAA